MIDLTKGRSKSPIKIDRKRTGQVKTRYFKWRKKCRSYEEFGL